MSILDTLTAPFRRGNNSIQQSDINRAMRTLKAAERQYGWIWADWSQFGRTGVGGENSDLLHTDYGAAQAHSLAIAAYRAVDARMRAVGSMPWRIIDEDNDKIIDESESSKFNHPFAKALQAAYSKENQSLFSMWEMSMCVTGKAFIEPVKGIIGSHYTGIEWLNPLAVQVVAIQGEIDYYQYNGADGYVRYAPDELAYERFPTLLSDHLGMAPLYVAMNRVNVSLNTDRFLMAFYRNDARFGQIISPPDGAEAFSELEVNRIKQQAQAVKGSDGSWRSWISPHPVKTDYPDTPDLSSQVETNDRVDSSIYTALGVPRPVAGDVDGQRYQASPEALEWFYQNTVIPRCRDIAGIINDDLLPRFDRKRSVRFEFDTSEWERLSETKKAQLEFMERGYENGVVTYNELRSFYNNYVTGVELKPIENGNLVKIPGSGILTRLDDLGKITAEETIVETDTGTMQELPDSVDEADDNENSPPVENVATQEDALSELRTWRKYAKKHGAVKALDFETFHLEDWQRSRVKFAIADDNADDAFSAVESVLNSAPPATYTEYTDAYIKCISDYADEALTVQLAEAHALRIAAQKAIQATRIEYEDTVEDMLLEAVRGNIDRRRAGNILRGATQLAIGKAYIDGLEDGGITEPELTNDDREWIANWFDQQRKYINALMDAIYKDDRVTEDEVTGKPAMWFVKSVQPAYHEGLASASKNGSFQWALGNTEDHCRSCLALNGQVRRMSFWRDRIMPGDSRLACNGFNCDCKLVPTRSGLSRGRLPAWRMVHHHD